MVYSLGMDVLLIIISESNFMYIDLFWLGEYFNRIFFC